MSDLFSPMQLGALQLSNRILMAPLTRTRADANHVPTPLMADYYAQRATAGLIIAEATMVAEGNSAFWRELGIYSAEQILAWRQVTDAVHAKGGKIVLQLWHGGRACHPALNSDAVPVSAAAVAIEDSVHTPQGKLPYTVPRALSDDEIPAIVGQFRQAAINARDAGFDGVEVHGANGYLLDQFLRDGVNNRSGRYGGSLENRSRLLLEVVAAVVEVWGADRVGVRISPLNSYNSMTDSDPIALTRHVAAALNPLGLAYLHLMRADFFGVQHGDVVSAAREVYQGNLVGNMGYQKAEAEQALASGQLQAVAVGAAFIANPDLVARWQQNWPLSAPDQSTFYTQDAKGYSDYPAYQA